MESLDLVEKELAEMQAPGYTASPILQGATPYQYLVNMMRTHIKQSELESALIILPFHYVTRFMPILKEICRLELDVELSTRCVVCLLRCHMPRITSSSNLYNVIMELRTIVRTSVNNYRTTIGSNVAALTYLKQKAMENSGANEIIPIVDTKKRNN